MDQRYPLTRKDFEAATRVLQRIVEFREAEDKAAGRAANPLYDRSAHLRESIKTLALNCDFWAAPERPRPQQRNQGRRRS